MDAAMETAIIQWEEGHRRLNQGGLDPVTQRSLQRSVNAIHAELRRRLGGAFEVSELVSLYQRGTDWCLDITFDLAPDDAPRPDPAVATDAAFWFYMREASDFAGGRVVTPSPGRD